MRIRTGEAERAKATEMAERALYNMSQALEDVGVDGVVSASDLTEFNEEQEHWMTAAEAATSDRTWAYGHVVVDEAQELTPMQWRVLMRRCPMKSFTVVGDIAQAGSASAASSWGEALAPFVGSVSAWRSSRSTTARLRRWPRSPRPSPAPPVRRGSAGGARGEP